MQDLHTLEVAAGCRAAVDLAAVEDCKQPMQSVRGSCESWQPTLQVTVHDAQVLKTLQPAETMLQVWSSHGVDVGTQECCSSAPSTGAQSRHKHSTCLGGGGISGVAVVVLGTTVVVAGALVVVLGTDVVMIGGGGLHNTGI